MATIEQNVNQAISDFDDIKGAIINKGVAVPSGTHTYEFADKIALISSSVMLPVQAFEFQGSYWKKVSENTFASAQPQGTPGAVIDGTYKSFSNNKIEATCNTSLSLTAGDHTDPYSCKLYFNVPTKIKLELSTVSDIGTYYRVTVWAEYKAENNTYYEELPEYWQMIQWDSVSSDYTVLSNGIVLLNSGMGLTFYCDGQSVNAGEHTCSLLEIRTMEWDTSGSHKCVKSFPVPTKVRVYSEYAMSKYYAAVLTVCDKVLPSSVSVTASSSSVEKGSSIQMTAGIMPVNAIDTVIWSTSSYYDCIDQNGLLTIPSFFSDNYIYVYATTVNGIKSTGYYLTVAQSEIMPTGVFVSPNALNLNVGEQGILSAIVYPTNTTYPNVTWSSNNSSVASVLGGVVTGNSAGSATITATTVNGYTGSSSVTVSGSEPEPSGDYTLFDGFTHIGTSWEKQSDGIYYAKSYIVYGGSIGNYITEQGGAEISLKTSYDEFNTGYLCVYYGPSPGSGYPGNDTFLIYEGDPIDFKLKKTDGSHIEILAKTSSPEPVGDWTPLPNTYWLGVSTFVVDGHWTEGMYSSYTVNSGSSQTTPSNTDFYIEDVSTVRFGASVVNDTFTFPSPTDLKVKYIPNGDGDLYIWYKGSSPEPEPSGDWLIPENGTAHGTMMSYDSTTGTVSCGMGLETYIVNGTSYDLQETQTVQNVTSLDVKSGMSSRYVSFTFDSPVEIKIETTDFMDATVRYRL